MRKFQAFVAADVANEVIQGVGRTRPYNRDEQITVYIATEERFKLTYNLLSLAAQLNPLPLLKLPHKRAIGYSGSNGTSYKLPNNYTMLAPETYRCCHRE